MGEPNHVEKGGSQFSKLQKPQQRNELTPEQIQQQNILRLNGFSTSTILRNSSTTDMSESNSPGAATKPDTLLAPPGLANALASNINNINSLHMEEPASTGTSNNLAGFGDNTHNTISTGNGTNPPTSNNEEIDDDLLDPMDRFGLKGLSSLLRQDDNDQNNIAKGVDLNMLGLDLSANTTPHILSKTLSSPWLETSRSEVEPLFTSPHSFRIDPNELLPIEDRMPSFNDLTLFFIFYTKPKDILQELSARELNKRNWRYHKELQVWLTKDTNSEPKSIGIGAEEGTYIFFDPVSWDFVTKTLVLYYNSII